MLPHTTPPHTVRYQDLCMYALSTLSDSTTLVNRPTLTPIHTWDTTLPRCQFFVLRCCRISFPSSCQATFLLFVSDTHLTHFSRHKGYHSYHMRIALIFVYTTSHYFVQRLNQILQPSSITCSLQFTPIHIRNTTLPTVNHSSCIAKLYMFLVTVTHYPNHS